MTNNGTPTGTPGENNDALNTDALPEGGHNASMTNVDVNSDLANKVASTTAGVPIPEGKTLRMNVWRGDSDGGDFKEYDVPVDEGMVVLDAVFKVQETHAPDLAVRWNCKAGKCGSCSAEINGYPKLMCMTRLDTLPEGPVTVNPMKTFPVIRDLVTDVSFNYEKARQVPEFTPVPRPEGGHRMMQEDVQRGQEFRKCIECFMCQNVCHVVRDHEENKQNFAGPRFLMRHAELDMHPLNTVDQRQKARDAGLGYCNITKCCGDVCPEHIKITDNALIPMKERVADRKFDPLVWLGDKILRRPRDGETSPADRA